MKFLIICLFSYLKNSKKTELLMEKSNTNLAKNIKNNGFDQRDINKDSSEYVEIYQIYQIYQNLQKKKIIDLLENQNISINTKIDILHNVLNYSEIKPMNICSGGLMKNFDFIF
jgi:hypothetical protein